MITKLDRAIVRKLQDEMFAAMQVVAAKHGLTVINKGGTFSATSTLMKFDVITRGETGELNSRERESFKQCATLYGLEVTDLDRTFTAQGSTFKIIGLKTGHTAYPVLAKRVDNGKTYKFEASRVKALLQRDLASSPAGS